MQAHVLGASSRSGPSGLDAGIHRAAAAAARRHLTPLSNQPYPTKTSVPCPQQKRPSAASGRLTASSLPLHLAARPAQAKSAG